MLMLQHLNRSRRKRMVLLQIALKNTMGMAVNNTENEKKKQCLLLPDGLFAVRRSIQSFPDFSVICHDRNVTIARSAHRGM